MKKFALKNAVKRPEFDTFSENSGFLKYILVPHLKIFEGMSNISTHNVEVYLQF